MGTKIIDYIIVGQGLAGSCLALQLLFLNKKILVIDYPDAHAATQVAAGLFNPITGRKMAKTWMADELYPYLHDFYRRAEAVTGSDFFYPMPLYRPFVSVEEQNEWMGRSSDPEFSEYIGAVHTHPMFTQQVNNPLGGLLLKSCGYINTKSFTKAIKDYVEKQGEVVQENFDEDFLVLKEGSVQYKDWTVQRIIFCTGEKIRTSKFFSWLPVRPLKGETLRIQTNEPVSMIYNRGLYIVPGLWTVGATYNAADSSPGTTAEANRELTQKLNELIAFPYEIVGQNWGIRPTTPDRRPILGPHPEFEQLIIFNGLGTKGVSLAPYFSEMLCLWLENGHPLNKSVSVNRYKSLYSKAALK